MDGLKDFNIVFELEEIRNLEIQFMALYVRALLLDCAAFYGKRPSQRKGKSEYNLLCDIVDMLSAKFDVPPHIRAYPSHSDTYTYFGNKHHPKHDDVVEQTKERKIVYP